MLGWYFTFIIGLILCLFFDSGRKVIFSCSAVFFFSPPVKQPFRFTENFKIKFIIIFTIDYTLTPGNKLWEKDGVTNCLFLSVTAILLASLDRDRMWGLCRLPVWFAVYTAMTTYKHHFCLSLVIYIYLQYVWHYSLPNFFLFLFLL